MLVAWSMSSLLVGLLKCVSKPPLRVASAFIDWVAYKMEFLTRGWGYLPKSP